MFSVFEVLSHTLVCGLAKAQKLSTPAVSDRAADATNLFGLAHEAVRPSSCESGPHGRRHQEPRGRDRQGRDQGLDAPGQLGRSSTPVTCAVGAPGNGRTGAQHAGIQQLLGQAKGQMETGTLGEGQREGQEAPRRRGLGGAAISPEGILIRFEEGARMLLSVGPPCAK